MSIHCTQCSALSTFTHLRMVTEEERKRKEKTKTKSLEPSVYLKLWARAERASLETQLVKNRPVVQGTRLIPGSGRSPVEGIGCLLQYPWTSGGSDSKESTCNTGDLGSIPGMGKSPGGGHGNPLLSSCLENPHGQRSLLGPSP